METDLALTPLTHIHCPIHRVLITLPQYCDQEFANKVRLKEHERIHTDENPFSCTNCDQEFADEVNLKNHERRDTDEKPFICNDCGKESQLRCV